MKSKRMISVVGCHAEAEIGDVMIGGVLPPAGETMFDKMRIMERDHDDVRRLLHCERRGSVARHINLIVPPSPISARSSWSRPSMFRVPART